MNQLEQTLRAAGFREYTDEDCRRDHERLGHCPAQPCHWHWFKFYGGRAPGPWEWESDYGYRLRRAVEFLEVIEHWYADGPEPQIGTWQ